jgi:hypothetical protein
MDKTNEDGKEDANSFKDDKDANSCNGRDNRKFSKLYIPKINRSITSRGGVAAVVLVLVGVWLLGTVIIVMMIRTGSTKDSDLVYDYSIYGCWWADLHHLLLFLLLLLCCDDDVIVVLVVVVVVVVIRYPIPP